MKKTLLLLIAVLLYGASFSQVTPKLQLTPEGIEPVTLNVDGLSASEIYKKSLDWVQETYKNPDEVLKANIENKKIRIDGFSPDALSFKNMVVVSWGVSYSLEISFKDGRCRYDYDINYFTGSDGGRTVITYVDFYKKNGDIRKSYLPAVSSLENTINDLLLNYYNYITGKTDAANDDW